MMKMTITMSGGEVVERGLSRINADITDLKPAMENVGQVILDSVRRNFIQQGRPTRWSELRPRTQRERAKAGFEPDYPVLIRTGALMRAGSERGADGNIFDADSKSVTVGVSLPKASELQEGNSYMKPRPFFMVQADDLIEMIKKIQEFVFRGW